MGLEELLKECWRSNPLMREKLASTLLPSVSKDDRKILRIIRSQGEKTFPKTPSWFRKLQGFKKLGVIDLSEKETVYLARWRN